MASNDHRRSLASSNGPCDRRTNAAIMTLTSKDDWARTNPQNIFGEFGKSWRNFNSRIPNSTFSACRRGPAEQKTVEQGSRQRKGIYLTALSAEKDDAAWQ
jgi:hypothetical protein